MAAHTAVPTRRTSLGLVPESVLGAFKQTRSLLSPSTELFVTKARCQGRNTEMGIGGRGHELTALGHAGRELATVSGLS
jgi:hypothetical protein